MTKRPAPRSPSTVAPKAPSARPASAATTLAASQQVLGDQQTDEQRAEAEAARQAEAEKAASLAKQQRQALADGETGQEQADALKGEDGTATLRHSIADPKAVPVDYGASSLRKPAQTIIPTESDVIANRPYGSEPREIDPATGLPPVTGTAPEDADVHGSDTDADVDRGSSAAQRAASAS